MDVVHRQWDRDELGLVAPALREERPDRPIDHPRCQRPFLAGASLALEEGAGDLARGIHSLLDVDGQRQEVGVAQIAGRCGREDHCVALADYDGAAGLLCNSARLKRDLASRDLHGEPGHTLTTHMVPLWPRCNRRRCLSLSLVELRNSSRCAAASLGAASDMRPLSGDIVGMPHAGAREAKSGRSEARPGYLRRPSEVSRAR